MIFAFSASFYPLIILLAQWPTSKQLKLGTRENERCAKNQIISSFQRHALFDHPPMQISVRARGRIRVNACRIHAVIQDVSYKLIHENSEKFFRSWLYNFKYNNLIIFKYNLIYKLKCDTQNLILEIFLRNVNIIIKKRFKYFFFLLNF